MKKERLLVLAIMAMFTINVFSQQTEWEPQTNITGYGAIEYDYFKDLKYFDRDYAISLTEVGLLGSYKPKEKLTLKTVFVYRPGYSFDHMLNEANAEYKFADFLNVKGGRFLTPLSPMNTYYYSPVNNSATLPMLIQNHEFFPLNMDAVSVNGKIGENLKVDYNLFFGGFRNALWLKTGSLGIFADESNYFQRVINLDTLETAPTNANEKLQFGGGAHAGISFMDYITIGFNYFRGNETADGSYNDMNGKEIQYTTSLKKTSVGINALLKYSTVKLIGEYWKTTLDMEYFGFPFQMKYKGAFAELSNSFGRITPYVRYEYHDIPSGFSNLDYYRYTGGINYKPMFETTFKLEYLHYKYQELSLSGVVATFIYAF